MITVILPFPWNPAPMMNTGTGAYRQTLWFWKCGLPPDPGLTAHLQGENGRLKFSNAQYYLL
jgi:hypothetical protein